MSETRICPYCEGPCSGCGAWAEQNKPFLTEYANRCREANEWFKLSSDLWLLLRDVANLMDGAPCPVDSTDQWKADVRRRMAEALRRKPWSDPTSVSLKGDDDGA